MKCGNSGISKMSSITAGCSLALSALFVNTTATAATVTGTLPSPVYPAGSVQLALFTQLNQARTECGFPALQENQLLDKAAQNHAVYGAANGTGSDTEIQGKKDFTGVTDLARVVSVGFPSNVLGGGASVDVSTSTAATEAQQGLDQSMLAGIYGAASLFTPVDLIGIGAAQGTLGNGQSTPSEFMSIDVFNTATQPVSSSPITFPCEGSTNVALLNSQQIDPAPGTDVTGPQILVIGNSTDTIALTSGTLMSSTGTSIPLTLLDSKNDPNKLLRPFQSAAYVPLLQSLSLQANTQYSVSLNGTVNGKPFSRTFTMTAGTSVLTSSTSGSSPKKTSTPTPPTLPPGFPSIQSFSGSTTSALFPTSGN
ncbi:hypothetical protein GCM10027093_59090 [Paraburkholderia jirisanensis]